MGSQLQFIALTSEMISLSHFIVAHCLLFPNYSQPEPNARLPSPAQAPASHHSSTTWLVASSTLKKKKNTVMDSLLRNCSFSYPLFWRRKGRNDVLCMQNMPGTKYERMQDMTCCEWYWMNIKCYTWNEKFVLWTHWGSHDQSNVVAHHSQSLP